MMVIGLLTIHIGKIQCNLGGRGVTHTYTHGQPAVKGGGVHRRSESSIVYPLYTERNVQLPFFAKLYHRAFTLLDCGTCILQTKCNFCSRAFHYVLKGCQCEETGLKGLPATTQQPSNFVSAFFWCRSYNAIYQKIENTWKNIVYTLC